jgi:hypothetical protein
LATPYSDIFELFLAGIRDYRIDKLYQSATPLNAEVYMTPFLIKGLVNFNNCTQDLESRDDTTREFSITLTTSEKVILSNLMLIEWATKEIHDILQMNLYLNDGDFSRHSEAQNLREKRALLDASREAVDKQITQYGYKNIDWTTLG